MKLLKNSLVIFALFSGLTNVYAQNAELGLSTITESSLKAQLNILAADWMEGREAGTKGEYMAGDYIASMFQVFGIEPFGDAEYLTPSRQQRDRGFMMQALPTYFQKFNIVKYKLSDEQGLSLSYGIDGSQKKNSYEYGIDYSVSNVETDLEINAPVVFVGYGIKDEKSGYNDFAKVDVKGKIIARLDGYPGYLDSLSPAYKKIKIDGLWDLKDRLVRESGAIAVITISRTPEKQFVQPSNLPFYYKSGEYEGDTKPQRYYDYRAYQATDSISKAIPQIRLSARIQNELLRLASINVNEFEQRVKYDLRPESKEIQGSKVGLSVGVQSELIGVRNVLGIIEGEKKDEFVVVGAHYDHVGKYNGYIYNGADDNGSGVVGVIAIARAIKASGRKPDKSIIFAAWTAEERGLLGSNFFVRNNDPSRKLLFNLNMDMISRSTENDSLKNSLSLGYTKKYGGFRDLIDSIISQYGLSLKIKYNVSEKPVGGSDYSSFSEAGLPIISFFSGMHPDYHQPSDELEKINWKKMEHIVKLGFLTTYQIANVPLQDFVKDPSIAEQ